MEESGWGEAPASSLSSLISDTLEKAEVNGTFVNARVVRGALFALLEKANPPVGGGKLPEVALKEKPSFAAGKKVEQLLRDRGGAVLNGIKLKAEEAVPPADVTVGDDLL